MSDEYNEKIRAIRAVARDAAESVTASEETAKEVRNLSERSIRYLGEHNERLKKAEVFINSWPERPNPALEAELLVKMDMLERSYEGIAADAKRQQSIFQGAHHNFVAASTSLAVSLSATSVTESLIISTGEVFLRAGGTKAAQKTFEEPGMLERRKQLNDRLMQVKEILATKFDEANSSFADKRYMSAAHAMREVLSGLGHALASNNEVKEADWYESQDGRDEPTQAQRIKYSIVGKTVNPDLTPEVLKKVEDLAADARLIYTRLNGEAHRRDDIWERDTVRHYLSTAEAAIRQVFELRETLGTA